MVIGLITIRISIPEARSLKDKRSVLRSLKDRILNQMNFSVAETGQQDQWRFAEMAFVTVAATREIVQKRVSALHLKLETEPRFVLMDIDTAFL
jgi:hypothetical protein